jgi:O-acetyl-ADP-ribose deacetylase (regulator of RNase III)
MIVAETPHDIFASTAQTLVCPVNTVGAMGAGLALAFKIRFPGLLEAYQRACAKDLFRKDGIWVYEVKEMNSMTQKILCIPTKRHWRHPSKIEWVDQGLECIAEKWKELDIADLAIPAVGCGNGRLPWVPVRALIYKWLDPLELPVVIHTPADWVSVPPKDDTAVLAEE